MQLLDQLKQGLLYFDGGTGTMFQAAGLAPANCPKPGTSCILIGSDRYIWIICKQAAIFSPPTPLA